MKSHKKDYNVIWIELENHHDDDKNNLACEEANILLKALGITYCEFGWMRVGRNRKSYVLHDNQYGTYSELVEDGKLFNLSHIAERLRKSK